MDHFAIGMVSFVLSILFVCMYLVGFQARRVGAWSRRENGPRDRVSFFVILMALIGFVAGCFAQPIWTKGAECKAAGQPIATCVFLQTVGNTP